MRQQRVDTVLHHLTDRIEEFVDRCADGGPFERSAQATM
jgi:hypothetical protein